MSAKEIYANAAPDERRSSRRFVIILAAFILLLFALTVGALYAIFNSQRRRTSPARTPASSSSNSGSANESESYQWKIAGALSQACICETCAVVFNSEGRLDFPVS
ncbi:MAG: hypothetical protein LC731_04455 [Acidobacteria bacterium]|nr:hypothetical protein [Acidobacteriota bacterium]